MKKLLFLIFCLSLILGGSVPSVNATHATLTGGDLTYLGAFQMPHNSGSADTGNGSCLALRHVVVGGVTQVRLFSSAYTGVPSYAMALYEVTPPTLTTSPPWNIATVARDWYNGGTVQFTHLHQNLFGLYWDETDQRLYYSSGSNYLTSSNDPTYPDDPYAPSLAFLTLNDTNGTAISHGRWGFANRSVKQVNMGLAAVPTDFQSQYSVGRLVAGFGGYQSIMEFGPASMGPSLTAFSPPVIGTEESYLANTPLVGYGASTWRTGTPTVQWMWKDDDVVADIWGDSIDPDNSRPIYDANQEYWMQGYSVTSNTRSNYPGFVNVPVGGNHPVQGDAYFGVDYINQSGVWIQTANKEGVVILGNMSTGRTWYDVSDLNWEGMKHQWLIYSRTQMGKVASGSVASDQIQPARYTVQFPTIPYPASGTAGTATNDDGVTFPTSTSANLYGAQSATSATIGTPNCSPNYCFTVQAGLAYTPGMMMMALVPGGNIALGTWIRGLVKSYSGTSLVMDASWGTQGSGAHSSWSITGQQNGALPRFQCIGMAYDSINQNLYIAIRYASAAPALGDSVVYVYHVNDTGGGGDTTPPTVAVSTSSPQTITSDSLTITGTATDAVGVTGCKYRIGSEPDATHGTACTGTTSWSCAASGHSNGSNTDYVECYDAAGNYSSGHSIAVTYNPPTVTKRSKIGGQTINHAGFSGQ